MSLGIGRTPTISGINWRICQGEHWVISGGMGMGKTTLANGLAGRARAFSGEREYYQAGTKVNAEVWRRIAVLVSFTDTSSLFRNANAVHYYQQRFNAFDSDGHLTVQEYLESSGLSMQIPEHLDILERIGIRSLLALERIKLSSGQTRKMLLARALLARPELVILDNPYLGLDQASRQAFNALVDELALERRVTFVFSGHYKALPECITHRIHLDQGKVLFQGTTQEVELQVKEQIEDLPNEEALSRIKDYFVKMTPKIQSRNIFELVDISLGYGGTSILNRINWVVQPGEKWALLGPNGAGKSSLLSLIYGDNPQAFAQRIKLFGRRKGSGESIWDIKRRIGFTSPELHAFFSYNLTAEQVVLTGLTDNFALPKRPVKEAVEVVEHFFDYFRIGQSRSKYFRQLSTGQQRLVLFIRALIKAPELLLLDEPFQGFDHHTVVLSKKLLDAALNEGNAMVFITHYQDEIPDCVALVKSIAK